MQHELIPLAILGCDLICQAKAGHGKTLIYVIALLQQLGTFDKSRFPLALVMCPTPELVRQTELEFKRIGKHMQDVKILALVPEGDLDSEQEKIMASKPAILIGMHDRLAALAERPLLSSLLMCNVKHVVIDKADAIFDRPGTCEKFSHLPSLESTFVRFALIFMQRYMQRSTCCLSVSLRRSK